MLKVLVITILCNLIFLSTHGLAKGVYLEPKEFLEQAFAENPPKLKKLWISKELKAQIKSMLGYDIHVVRLRYWDNGEKTAWILEEIGRDKPITTGVVVKDEKIERLNVLIFRESRGWEVKYPFFTDQFKQANLTEKNQLDRNIDNISGATLSVNALTKVAKLALFLNTEIKID